LKANLDVDKKTHRQSIEVAKASLEKARYDLKTSPVQSAIVSEQLKLAEEEAAAQYKELLGEVKNKDISQEAQLRISVLEHDQTRSNSNAPRPMRTAWCFERRSTDRDYGTTFRA